MSTAEANLAKLRDMFREGTTPRQLAEEALAELEALQYAPAQENADTGQPDAIAGLPVRKKGKR